MVIVDLEIDNIDFGGQSQHLKNSVRTACSGLNAGEKIIHGFGSLFGTIRIGKSRSW